MITRITGANEPPPDKVYLQWYGPESWGFYPDNAVTWSKEKRNKTDVPYVRFEKYKNALDEITELQHEVSRLKRKLIPNTKLETDIGVLVGRFYMQWFDEEE